MIVKWAEAPDPAKCRNPYDAALRRDAVCRCHEEGRPRIGYSKVEQKKYRALSVCYDCSCSWPAVERQEKARRKVAELEGETPKRGAAWLRKMAREGFERTSGAGEEAPSNIASLFLLAMGETAEDPARALEVYAPKRWSCGCECRGIGRGEHYAPCDRHRWALEGRPEAW